VDLAALAAVDRIDGDYLVEPDVNVLDFGIGCRVLALELRIGAEDDHSHDLLLLLSL
jgi:hypothetical protein